MEEPTRFPGHEQSDSPDMLSFVQEIWLPSIQGLKHSWRVDERIARQHILPFFGASKLSELTREAVLEWLEGFDSRNFAISTRNRILCVMKGIFKAACEKNYLDARHSPVARIHCAPEKRQETVNLSGEDIERLLARLKTEKRVEAHAISLLVHTGASKNEILTARWEHYDPIARNLVVRAQSGRQRTINLNGDAVNVIESIARQPHSPWLFPGRAKDRPITHIFPYWNKIRRECGLKSVRIQDLRYAIGHEIKKSASQRAREDGTSGDLGHLGVTHLPVDNQNVTNGQGAAMPIAIIGMGMRFPGNVHDEDSMWSLLNNRQCAITRIPASRWPVEELTHPVRQEQGRSVTFAAGVLDDIDLFDASFFKISPREAAWMDPQQRILLEIAHEAMEDAGIPAEKLAGTFCGVFVGISGMDYGQHALADLASMTGHTMTGNTLSIAANRISYFYDLHGPSLAMDTACSSGLAAVHQACQALRNGEVPMALAGGVNLLMHPYSFIGFSHASMLSASGRCRPFDAAGDGYVRGEGAALLLLKPLERAIADGDHIHAVIVGSGVNSDGARKNGLTIPSEEAQFDLMRGILSASGITNADVDYVEAHGTGTPAGDPVEARSIGRAYGGNRPRPLPISSAKANFGHLEPASGMVGLVKAILAIKHGEVPPMPLDFTPNPNIDFSKLNIFCAANGEKLHRDDGRQFTAAVNSFGFGGLNAHVLVRGHADIQNQVNACESVPPLFLSADNDKALREIASAYLARMEDISSGEYYNLAYGAAFRRSRLEKRAAIWADDLASVREALRACANGESSRYLAMESVPGNLEGIAFVYSGNGSQWHGMGRALYEESPEFAEIISFLDAKMAPVLGYSVTRMLLEGDPKTLEDTAISQPLLFAMQVGITSLLRQLGIKPMAVAGHSVGEVAAAWAAGALSLTQAIQVIHARSLVQSRTFGMGKMAAMAVSSEQALNIINDLGLSDRVEIAAANSPGNCTISGDAEALRHVQEHARENNIFFKLLDLEYAFHSRQMDIVKKDLEDLLADLEPVGEGESVFISTVSGSEMEGREASWEYWWRNIREPVNFRGAIESLFSHGARIFVEIGPHAVLQRYIRENLSQSGRQIRVLPTLQKGNPGMARLRNVAASIHLLSGSDQWSSLFPQKGVHCRLPLYPWQKQSCWFPRTSEELPQTRRRQPLAGWPLPGTDPLWENILDPRKDTWLGDHKVGGVIVFPAAGYMEMALEAARAWLGSECFGLENFDILLPLIFEGGHAQCVRCSINASTGFLRITSRPRLGDGQWLEHAHCRVISACIANPVKNEVQAGSRCVNAEELYSLAASLGLDYGPFFRRVEKINIDQNILEADLLPAGNEKWVLDPAVLDACFHSLAPLYGTSESHSPYLPVGAARVARYSENPAAYIRGYAHKGASRVLHADFDLFDAENNLVASVRDCRFRPAPTAAESSQKVDCWEVRPWLEPIPLPKKADSFSPAELLARSLEHQQAGIKDRTLWHGEILPRLEALVIAGIAGVFKNLPPSESRSRNPYFIWMRNLLIDEGLLDVDGNGKDVVHAGDLPEWLDLWRETYVMAPQFLPALLPIARVLDALPDLANDRIDQAELLEAVRAEVIASEYSAQNPAYAGTDATIADILRNVAADWPKGDKLKVLDIGSWPGNVMRTLMEALPPDYFSCLCVLPEKNAGRAPELSTGSACGTVCSDPFQWLRESGSESKFDLVILRQIIHRSESLSQSLDRIHDLLLPGGLLILDERHSDWSADIVEGLEPGWWQTVENGAPVSSRMHPEAWEKILIEHGFEDCVIHKESHSEGLEEGAFLILARKKTQLEAEAPKPSGSWLILADDAASPLASGVTALLESSGATVAFEKKGTFCPDNVIFMSDVSEPAQAAVALDRLAKCAEHCARDDSSLWIITRGGSLAPVSPEGVCPTQATIAGLGRVIQNEFPDLKCRLIDLSPDLDIEECCRDLQEELAQDDGPDEITRDRSGRHVARVLATDNRDMEVAGRCVLRIRHPGRLDNLVWEKLPELPLADDEVEVRVMATGLNFRDVMLSMGLLPEDALEKGFAGPTLGLEFAGIVSATGKNVRDFSPGDRVAGFGAACFASHVKAPAHALAHISDDTDFAAAAALPTVFITAWYALKHLARLSPGETVLIHGGAGGVGLAAIQIARSLGAKVFVTAGTPEKRDFLKCLGVDAIFDSRSLDFFDAIMAETDGQGVDVVLNSLAGEAMRRSMALLKPFGRFLELGKRDYVENTAVGLRPLKENISYFSIDVDQLLTAKPELASELYREVSAKVENGAFTRIPYRVFPAARVVEAFRVMQQARHMGKIVVDMSMLPSLPSDARETPDFSGTWLVSGGLGGFGLATARHLADSGVKSLVLASRRGQDAPDAAAICAEFAERGVEVRAEACDFSDAGAVRGLIEKISSTMQPLTGIVHAAAVFDDALLSRTDLASFERVLNPKFIGAWNLHEATLHLPLKHFVLYSSISVALGNPGQGNYVAANAGQEAITRLRMQAGLPAVCIAWGPISDVGYLARNEAVRKNLSSRIGVQLSANLAMRMFNKSIARNGIYIIANMDWNAALRMMEIPAPRFAFLMEKTGKNALSGGTENMREHLVAMEPRAAREELRQCIIQETARVLGLNVDHIPAERNLQAMGLDSLMAMELALGLEHRTGMRLPPMLLQDAPTIDQLAERLFERISGDSEQDNTSGALLADLARKHSETLAPEETKDVLTMLEGSRK